MRFQSLKFKNVKVNFYGIASMGLVVQWMKNGMKENPGVIE
jgi:hypothetical protein